MDNVFETKSGTTLTLRAVKWTASWHIIRKLGGPEVLADPESIKKLTGLDALRAADATEQLFNYIAGWGVVESPPPGSMAELEALELSTPGQPHLERANWLRFLVLEDDDEASTLIARVLALTWAQTNKEQAVSGS